MEIRRKDALDYHRQGRKGKIEVTPTKPCRTQWDLLTRPAWPSLAKRFTRPRPFL